MATRNRQVKVPPATSAHAARYQRSLEAATMLNPKIFGTLSPAQAAILKGSDIKELVNFFDICQAAREAAY
jgi:hypothetical protein